MRNASEIHEVESGRLDHEAMAEGASQVGVGVIITLAAVVGAWGVACLIGGIVKVGSLLEMTRSWLAAVTGM